MHKRRPATALGRSRNQKRFLPVFPSFALPATNEAHAACLPRHAMQNTQLLGLHDESPFPIINHKATVVSLIQEALAVR